METPREETQPADQDGREASEAQITKESRVKRSSTWLALIGLVIAIGIVFFIMRPGSKNPPGSIVDQSSARPASELSPGVEVKLYIQGQKSVMVAADERALYDLISAIAAKSDKVQNLIQSGRVFAVPNDTRVRIVETGFPKIKVRVIEGDKMMSEGWVPESWVR